MFKRFVDVVQVLAAGAIALTVVLLLTATPTVAVVDDPDTAAGAVLYQARCSSCHGAEGGGGAGPALAGENALTRFAGPDEVARFVATGVPGSMPGFETRLGPDDINAIAAFVWHDLGER